MRFNKVILLMTMMLLTVSVNTLRAHENSFTPQWKIGQSWVVDTSYRDVRGSSAIWQPVTRWVFKVRNIKDLDGVECYVLHVHSASRSNENQAVLWLSVENLTPLKVIDVYKNASGVSYSERESGEVAAPLFAEDSIVPYDLPVFPLIRKEQDRSSGGDGVFNKRIFSKKRKTKRFSFKREVTQTDKLPERSMTDSFLSYNKGCRLSSSQLYQVSVKEARTGLSMEQVWQEGMPWAVVSNTANRRSRLVVGNNCQDAEESNGGEY